MQKRTKILKRAFFRPHKLTEEILKPQNNTAIEIACAFDIPRTSTITALGHPIHTTTAPIRMLDCFKYDWIDSLDYSKIFYLFWNLIFLNLAINRFFENNMIIHWRSACRYSCITISKTTSRYTKKIAKNDLQECCGQLQFICKTFSKPNEKLPIKSLSTEMHTRVYIPTQCKIYRWRVAGIFR